MDIVIEKNIPLPPPVSAKWHFLSQMEVGESAVIPDGYVKGDWRQYSQITRKHPDRKYVGRKIDGGTRVWRIE